MKFKRIRKLFKRKKEKTLPTIYDTFNNPIVPIRTPKDVKLRHGFQRPSTFSKEHINNLKPYKLKKKKI